MGSATNSELIYQDISTVGFRNGLGDIEEFYDKWNKIIIKKDRIGYLKQTYLQFRILPLIAAINSKSASEINKRIKEDKEVKKNKICGSIRYPFNIYNVSLQFSPYLFILTYLIISRVTFMIQKNNKRKLCAASLE